MNSKAILLLTLVFLSLVPVHSFAQSNGVSTVCIDNTTLQSSIERVRCVTIGLNTQCATIAENVTLTCPNGCDTSVYPNVCTATEFEANLVFLFIVIFVLIGLAFVIKKVS